VGDLVLHRLSLQGKGRRVKEILVVKEFPGKLGDGGVHHLLHHIRDRNMKIHLPGRLARTTTAGFVYGGGGNSGHSGKKR